MTQHKDPQTPVHKSMGRWDAQFMMKKRPRDPAQLAKLIVIATGEIEDRETAVPKVPLTRKEAAELGGKKRAVSLSKKRRKEIVGF